jgi:hypothetical protein
VLGLPVRNYLLIGKKNKQKGKAFNDQGTSKRPHKRKVKILSYRTRNRHREALPMPEPRTPRQKAQHELRSHQAEGALLLLRGGL